MSIGKHCMSANNTHTHAQVHALEDKKAHTGRFKHACQMSISNMFTAKNLPNSPVVLPLCIPLHFHMVMADFQFASMQIYIAYAKSKQSIHDSML